MKIFDPGDWKDELHLPTWESILRHGRGGGASLGWESRISLGCVRIEKCVRSHSDSGQWVTWKTGDSVKDKSERCTQAPEVLQVRDFGRERWKNNKRRGRVPVRLSRPDSA